MTVKQLTEHHLEFLTLKGGCKSSSESTLVKMPHCWKSHVAAIIFLLRGHIIYILYIESETSNWSKRGNFKAFFINFQGLYGTQKGVIFMLSSLTFRVYLGHKKG